MIRWILGILLVIVLILAIVFIFRRLNVDDDINVDVPGEVANNGEAASQMPNVVGDSAATSAGQPVQGNVLANDTDPQDEALTVNAEPDNAPTNGTLQLNEDGSFVYTPNAGYVGSDSFTYEVCDASGNCTTGVVQITVNSAVDGEPAEPGSTDGGEDTGTGAAEPSDSEGDGDTTDAQPTETSGTDTSGTDTSGTDTSGTDTSGTDTSGTDTSSTDTSGTDTSSTDTGDTASSGEGTQPTDSNNGTGGASTTDSGDATGTDSSADNTASSGSSNVSGQPITDPATHEIKQGEWLIQIGRCYGTSPETIVSENQIPYPGWIMAGEDLTISNIGSVSEAFLEPCIMFHTVVQGDTLYSLAQHYQVPLDMLIKANFGCYGYGYYYYPPVATPYGEDDAAGGWYASPKYGYGPGYGAHSPYIYTGCYVPYSNPTIYVGQELVIPVNLDNADMRPAPTPTQ